MPLPNQTSPRPVAGNMGARPVRLGAEQGGFATQPTERREWLADADVVGTVPAALRGTLFRNGPGRNELGGKPFGHWFDGDGLLHGITLRDGKVHFQDRYVRTPKYVRETAAGHVTERSYGTNRPGGVLRNAGRRPANAANTSVVYHGGKLLTLWEGGLPYRLDPATLDTIGPESYAGRLGYFDAFSAHAKEDPKTGRLYNHGVRVTPRGFVCDVYVVSPGGHLVQRGSFDIGPHPFLHDFAMTEHHLVFFQSPIRLVKPLEFLVGLTTLNDSMRYCPERPLEVVVVRKADLQVVRRVETDPFVVIHFGNAFEDARGLHIDLVHLEDFSVNEALSRRSANDVEHGGHLTRFDLDMANGRLESRRLSSQGCEFPAWDRRATGSETDVVFVSALLKNETPGFFNGLMRLNTRTGDEQLIDFGPDQFTSEPVHVPAPGSSSVDDGWVLTVVYDGARHGSELRVLRAANLHDEVARVRLPQHVPFGFHGTWVDQTFV